MTYDEFRFLLTLLNLTQGQAATFLGTSIRTVNNYANGRAPIPVPVRLLLRLMRHTRMTPGQLQSIDLHG